MRAVYLLSPERLSEIISSVCTYISLWLRLHQNRFLVSFSHPDLCPVRFSISLERTWSATPQDVPPCPLQSGLSPAKSPGPSSSSQKVSFFLRVGRTLPQGGGDTVVSPKDTVVLLSVGCFFSNSPWSTGPGRGWASFLPRMAFSPPFSSCFPQKFWPCQVTAVTICISLGFPVKQNPPLIIENIIMSYCNVYRIYCIYIYYKELVHTIMEESKTCHGQVKTQGAGGCSSILSSRV